MSLTCCHLNRAYEILLTAEEEIRNGNEVSSCDLAHSLYDCMVIHPHLQTLVSAYDVFDEIPCAECGRSWRAGYPDCSCGTGKVLVGAEKSLFLIAKAKTIIESKAQAVYHDGLAKMRGVQ